MLRELLERSRKALAELDNLFSESKRYFDEVINNITREFKLTEEDVNELNRFKETMLELLDRAHTQARERLPKLVAALEKRSSKGARAQ
jgi:ABC-type transporter Mla subunit MlaD